MARERDELAGYYDARYYATRLGEPCHRASATWHSFFDRAAAAIVAELAPRTVLDAGCGIGLLVEKLRDRGVAAWGVDISRYAVEQVRDDIRPYVSVASITEDFGRHYDLIVCIEVVEHLPPEEATDAIVNIAAHTNSVLFSSTPSDFREPTHVNVRPTEHWVEHFARHGFFRNLRFDATFITPQTIHFERANQTAVTVARDYEAWHWRTATELRELREENLALTRREQEVHALLSLRQRVAPAGSRRAALLRRVAGARRGG